MQSPCVEVKSGSSPQSMHTIKPWLRNVQCLASAQMQTITNIIYMSLACQMKGRTTLM